MKNIHLPVQLKIKPADSLRRYALSFVAVFLTFSIFLGIILVFIYYAIIPIVPIDTATAIVDLLLHHTLPILGIILIPSLGFSLLLARSRTKNKELKTRLELQEQALEMVNDSIYIHTLNGNRIYASKEEPGNGGSSGDGTYGKDPVYSNIIRPRIEELIKSGEAAWESVQQIGEKTTVPVEVHSRIVTEHDHPSVLSVVRDVTERKRREEELRETTEKLQRAISSAIRSMASIAELRDPYTAGHQQRVAKLAAAIAEELGLPEEQIEGIRLAGTLHDIGKISIPAEILSKPGPLRQSEFALVKDHAEIGHSLLKMIEFPRPVAQMVLQHHERMDGSGYPHGLSGENILLEARIMGVADVIESMSSHRPYRPAFSIEKALLEIIMKKGILYDPAVVDACVRLFNNKKFKFD